MSRVECILVHRNFLFKNKNTYLFLMCLRAYLYVLCVLNYNTNEFLLPRIKIIREV